ncbi:hypothetical protein AD937_00405 [Gluconobacter japonicus]|nr:hypothetical protein AD937_00405 [Gluconobacter japonicus]
MRESAADAPQSRMDAERASPTTCNHQGTPKLLPAPIGDMARNGKGWRIFRSVMSPWQEMTKTGFIKG